MEGQVADLRDMMKKMLEIHNQTAASVEKGLEGKNTNYEIRKEDDENASSRLRPTFASRDSQSRVRLSPPHRSHRLIVGSSSSSSIWCNRASRRSGSLVRPPRLRLTASSSPLAASFLRALSRQSSCSSSRNLVLVLFAMPGALAFSVFIF
ncbi:hypothetical protein M5K25_010668 [Dendrobium thyrsiflorum]|uniref:Uncharacterized protein n=1 Tax=Dendrobium thyrsiflorum TaxID=117978 RepID=A0ABD0V0P2_DENTH